MNRAEACAQLSRPIDSSVIEYAPRGSRSAPMRSLWSTSNVLGQSVPDAGCDPPPPPLGADARATLNAWPDGPVKDAVAASSRHGEGSTPSKSRRNWRNRSEAAAHDRRAGSRIVIV